MKKRIAITILCAALVCSQAGPAHTQESAASLDRVIRQIETMFPPTEGLVLSVDGNTLILDLKQGQPVQPGDRLNLIRFGEDIIHPVTKKKIGRKETDLGVVEILEVRKDFSLARATDPAVKAEAGDGVRSPFKRLSFLITPPKVETGEKIDTDRLRLSLEERLNEHPRFKVPTFDLGLWLLEQGLDTEKLLSPPNLDRLRGNVEADYILVPTVRSIKNKMVLSYELYSAEDGSLQKEAKVMSDQLPILPKPAPKPFRGEEPQRDFKRQEGPIQFVDKQEFPFEIVDFDVGDINGDGIKDYIIIDHNRVMVYQYEKGKFQKSGQVKLPAPPLNKFLSVDVGDINGNGRDEIFVTNQTGRDLGSFALEVVPGQRGLKPIWKNRNQYFRIIRPFGGKSILLTQSPGFKDPFQGPIRQIIFQNGRYIEGPEIQIPDVYGTEFILYGLTQADLNRDGKPETIVLDKGYHLRVYSVSGRILVKSDDYYGADPRMIDVRVREDIEGIVQQGEPVRFKGRLETLQTGKERYLLIPKNHTVGGGFLSKLVIVNNSSLVILGISREGLEKLFETKKQKGYLAAFHSVKQPESGDLQLHVATVDPGGFGVKPASAIITYHWKTSKKDD